MRVVSVGPVELREDLGPRNYGVAVTYEIESNGASKAMVKGDLAEAGQPGPKIQDPVIVRPVGNHPDRWIVAGGI